MQLSHHLVTFSTQDNYLRHITFDSVTERHVPTRGQHSNSAISSKIDLHSITCLMYTHTHKLDSIKLLIRDTHRSHLNSSIHIPFERKRSRYKYLPIPLLYVLSTIFFWKFLCLTTRLKYRISTISLRTFISPLTFNE